MKKPVSILIILVYLIISCSKRSGDNGDNTINGSGNDGGSTLNCSSVPKAFAADVNPIIQSFCNIANCHNSGSTNGPGPLTNYNQVFNSRIDIRSAIVTGVMPQNTTLTPEQKNSIICWIDSGAADN